MKGYKRARWRVQRRRKRVVEWPSPIALSYVVKWNVGLCIGDIGKSLPQDAICDKADAASYSSFTPYESLFPAFRPLNYLWPESKSKVGVNLRATIPIIVTTFDHRHTPRNKQTLLFSLLVSNEVIIVSPMLFSSQSIGKYPAPWLRYPSTFASQLGSQMSPRFKSRGKWPLNINGIINLVT